MSVATQSRLIPVSSSALCSRLASRGALLDLRLVIPRQLIAQKSQATEQDARMTVVLTLNVVRLPCCRYVRRVAAALPRSQADVIPDARVVEQHGLLHGEPLALAFLDGETVHR